jgi:hypothetical protein
MSILVATGNVNLTNTVVGSCPYSDSCRYPGTVAWSIPLGNHHLKLTASNIINSGTMNKIGLYSSPSGTAVDIPCDTTGPVSGEGNFPLTDTEVSFYYHGPVAFSGFDYVVDATPAPGDTPVTYCEYGTRIKPGLPSLVALTPATLLTIAGLFSKGFKTALAMFFAGRIVDTADLCGQLPPPVPTIEPIDIVNLTTYIAFGVHQDAFDKFWTWILAMVWPVFCECIPGTPDPVTPPPPNITEPPDLPMIGPQPCDNSDICALLMETKEELDGMYAFLAMVRSEIQALQSQSVPFDYVAGTLHSDLSGQGEFAVSGILGLSVQFTTVPSYLGRQADDPATIYSLGEIGLGTDDGWLRSTKCSHNPTLIMPIGPEISKVAYTFASGAVGNILELVRRAS